jgi:hypothetical protein
VILLNLLFDDEYFGDAAAALMHLARPAHETPFNRGWGRPDYGGIWERRSAAKSVADRGKDGLDGLRYADAIKDAIELRLQRRGKSGVPPFPSHSLMQASVALANLAEVQHVPTLVHAGVPDALEIAVLRGFVLPGDETYTALDPIITTLEQSVSGHRSNEWYYAEQCIRILLFTDAPGLAVARIRRLSGEVLRSYRIKHLVEYLGLCRAPEAAQFLAELVNQHDTLRHCMPEYIQALADCHHPSCRTALLALLDDLGKGQITGGDLPWLATNALADAIARLASADETIYAELESRCRVSLRIGKT